MPVRSRKKAQAVLASQDSFDIRNIKRTEEKTGGHSTES